MIQEKLKEKKSNYIASKICVHNIVIVYFLILFPSGQVYTCLYKMYILRTVACFTPFDGREKLHLKDRHIYTKHLTYTKNEHECTLKCLETKNCKMVFYLSGGSVPSNECYTLPYILQARGYFRSLKQGEHERFISYRPATCSYNENVARN